MNNLITLCAVLATAVYFVKAYDFQDSKFNQLVSSEFTDGLDSLESVSLHHRSRRDEEASMAVDDKCRKRPRRPKLCCAEDTFDMAHEKEKERTRACFKEILGVEKAEHHHHKKFDLFSCEEVEKRKNEMICVQQCVGIKKGVLAEDGTPIPEEIRKYLKDQFAKEAWVQPNLDKIVSACLAEAKNATENQIEPIFKDIKICNPSYITLRHCIFKEVQLSCPAEQIKDKAACDKFQDRVKKGLDMYGPPPPGHKDE